MRLSALLLTLAGPLSACSENASAQRGFKPGDTQVVAQWSLSAGSARQTGPAGLIAAEAAVDGCQNGEGLIADASGGLYFDDGDDVGAGTCNIYLYTDRVDETVFALIGLSHSRRIPSDLRIGVAVYKDAKHTDWTYRVAYPPTLKKFDLFGG